VRCGYLRPVPRNHHDALFKAVFSQPDQAAAHLRAVLPAEVLRHLDLSELRRSPGTFVDEELSERHSDLLFEALTTSGELALVYVLFEHQSSVEPLMPFRLLEYMVRVWRHWLGEHRNAPRLPVIVPLVVYHGRERWNAPTGFGALLDLSDDARSDLAPWLVELRYVLQELGRVTDDDLKGRALGRMALLLAKHHHDGELWRRLPSWVAALRAVLRESGLRAIETVMRYVIDVEKGPPPPEIQRLLTRSVGKDAMETVMSWAQKLREEGREEGLVEGREEGLVEGREEGRVQAAREMLLRLLRLRFGTLSGEVSASIERASIEQLEAWTDRVLSADSPEATIAE